MSAISLKSITGITSITTPAGVDNQLTLHTNNTTERVKINSSGNVSIANDLDVDGHTNLDNVSIAGVTTATGNIIAEANIGIGVASPDTLLEISSTQSGTGNFLKLTSTTNSQSSRPALVFWNNNPNTAQAQISAKGGASYNASKLHFAVANTSRVLQDRACIDEYGTFIIGPGETRRNTKGSNQHQALLIEGTGNNSTRMSMIRSSNDDNGPEIQLIKTRGTSIGSITKPNQNDYIGALTFLAGDDSDLYARGAEISVQATGTPANDRVPSDIIFSTTPTSGSTAPQERLRITSGGQLLINTTTAVRALTIKDPGQIHVESTSTGNWVGMSIKGSSGTNNYNAYFGLLDSNGRFFIDNGSNGEDFTITQTGKIGINQTNPTAQLHSNAAYNVTGAIIGGGAIGYNNSLEVNNANGVRLLTVGGNGSQLTRGSQGGRDSTGNASNFMKIGTWYGIDQTSRLKITIFGTSTYDANADVAGETIIYISNNANNTMKGHFHSHSNSRSCVQKVAFKYDSSTSPTNCQVWIKYNGGYSCTQHKVDASEGYWVGADVDTSSTSVPSGATEASSFFAVATSNGSQSYERLRIDSSGHMGLGVTPNTNWPTNNDFKALQIGTGACVFGRGSGDEDRGGIAVNFYHDGSARKYLANGHASIIDLNDGAIIFSNAASNSSGAGAAMTASERLRITSSGQVLIGDGSTYTPGSHLHLHGGTGGAQQLRVQNHTSIGTFSGNYGSEFRHAYSSTHHCMLIHTQEASTARRTLDISDSNGIFASFTNHKMGLGTGITSPNATLDIRTTDDDDAIRLVNTSTGNNGIQWWNEYGGLTKRASMDYGEGDANFDIKLFRADAQDDRPYGNVRIFTGSYSNPNMNFRVTTLGTVHQPNQPAFLVRDSVSANAFGSNTYADFDTVILNRGNHYNTSNGRFTAPIAGTYLFISLMLSNGSNRLFHEIRKNGSQVVGTRTESGTNAGQYQSNTTQAILELAKGDWVAIHVGSGGAYGGSYSNFSGYLLG